MTEIVAAAYRLIDAVNQVREQRGWSPHPRPQHPDKTIVLQATVPFLYGHSFQQVREELDALAQDPDTDPNELYLPKFVKRFRRPQNGHD